MIEMRDGDLLHQEDIQVIAHQVNCKGVMNSGIAKQIKEKYHDNFTNYKNFCILYKKNSKELGGKLLTTIEFDGKHIANLFSQGNYGYDGGIYTQYPWFESCMISLYTYAKSYNLQVIGVPYKIGCVRGGGDWNIVYKILEDIFQSSSLKLVMCKFDKD